MRELRREDRHRRRDPGRLADQVENRIRAAEDREADAKNRSNQEFVTKVLVWILLGGTCGFPGEVGLTAGRGLWYTKRLFKTSV
jgi:hypothetical protein